MAFAALIHALGSGLVAAAYAFALIAAAMPLIGALRLPRREASLLSLANLSTSFSLGFGFYGSAWILLGLGGFLTRAVVLTLLVVGVIAGVWSLWRSSAQVDEPAWRRRVPSTRTELLLGASLVVLLLVLAIASFRLPFGDPVAFYLAWPKVIAASHTIVPLPKYEEFSAVWMTSEANFSALMLLGGQSTTKFFVWLSLLAAVWAIRSIAADCGCGPRGQLLAALVLPTSTAVTNVTVDGKTDILAVAPSLLAILWALRLRRDAGGRTSVLIGLLASTAVGAKLSYAVPLAASLLTLVVVAGLESGGTLRERLLRTFGWMVIIGVAGAAMCAPQLLKNHIFFSQPLLPLIGASLGRDVWFSPDVVFRIIMTLPVALTFGQYWAQYGALSPLVLGLLPFLILWRPNGCGDISCVTRVTVAAAIGIAAWFVVLPSQLGPRYFLGPLLLFAIPAAWIGERAWTYAPKRIGRAVVLFAFSISAVTAVELFVTHARPAWRYLKDYARDGIDACSREPYCAMSSLINRQARPGERVAFFSYYMYYLRPDLIQCMVSEQELGAAGVTAAPLRAAGTRFILLDRAQYRPLSIPADLAVRLIHEDQAFSFYEVGEASQDASQTARCVEQRPGLWRVQKGRG